MAFSVAELAAAMGVDDPQRVFKKKTQAVKDRERFLAILNEYRALPEDDRRSTLAELSQTYLPTIIRARVEADFDPSCPFHFNWFSILRECQRLAPYERFIQQHRMR